MLDEVHTYRGIFGSNVANVMRRLERVCGALRRPAAVRLLLARPSPTPASTPSKLTGRAVELIDRDGSPAGQKHFVLWNPPLRRHFAGRAPPARTSRPSALMTDLVKDGVQTIAFSRDAQRRRAALRYMRERLERDSPRAGQARASAYRGGYLPEERREIERKLVSARAARRRQHQRAGAGHRHRQPGRLLIIGYPGTIASTWQQAGRAGRGADGSLVVLIAYNDPIDQYLMRHPGVLLRPVARKRA